jgi:alpha-amylase
MPSINLCFRIHQPYQFKSYCFNDIGKIHTYEDKEAMLATMNKLADNCYLPANKILLNEIRKAKGKFRVAFSISGTTLELFEQFRSDLIYSFRQLIETGCVEILAETYYNSLSWLHSKAEFNRQLKMHEDLVKKLFGVEPMVFRNTELVHDNELARYIAELGYKGMITEGVAPILNGRSPNQTYAAPDNGDFGILLRNTELCDDIACWFGVARAGRYALTAKKFADRIFHNYTNDSCSINLFLDYETFGIHKSEQTGIFKFLEELPSAIFARPGYTFKTPLEALDNCYPKGIYDVSETTSVNACYHDGKAWCNKIKENMVLQKLYKLEALVKESSNERLINTWGKLQSADHFYFIGRNDNAKGDSWHSENALSRSAEGYQQLVNILTDFEISMIKAGVESNKKRFGQHLSAMLF